MARHIAAIMCRKSCLIEQNGRCKGFPRIIVNVAVARNKINQLHVNEFFILQLKKSEIGLYFVFDTLIYFCILHVDKYIKKFKFLKEKEFLLKKKILILSIFL